MYGGAGGAWIDGRPIDLADVARAVFSALGPEPRPLLLLPGGEARYGDAVAALDQIHGLAAEGMAIRLGIPTQAEIERRGEIAASAIPIAPARLDDAVLVLKADSDAPWRVIDRILEAASGKLDRIVLLTDLDVSDRSLIGPDTWLGGLPGGLVLSLASEHAVVAVPGP